MYKQNTSTIQDKEKFYKEYFESCNVISLIK